MTILIQLV